MGEGKNKIGTKETLLPYEIVFNARNIEEYSWLRKYYSYKHLCTK